ncbi:putative cytochrome P450 [Hypoxylon crocopeplum]|nr:putative cytochrome P450 [Hypoxylon crocopeplum]
MYLPTITTILYDERVQGALFLFVIGLEVFTEIRAWKVITHEFYKKVLFLASRVTSIIGDYRSGKYYKPWKPHNAIVIVSTKKHIAELSEAGCLSQRAVYADMFGFKHTMNKFQHNTSEHKVIRTRLYSRMLQVNGPVHLDGLYPCLQSQLLANLDLELQSGRPSKDGISLPIAQMTRRLASQLMSVMFFGQMLSSDEEFSNALLQYPRDMVRCMMAFQITPSVASPLVHAILTKRGQAMHIIQKRFLECMGSSRADWKEPEETKRFTIMHNMSELTTESDYWSPDLLSQSLLGIWFAASHQPWMNLHFILVELCMREDWQARLRHELEQEAPLDYKRLERLPLLDSFIKETVRFNPLDKLAIRRKALEPYTFSDGTVSVPNGATVCVSAYDLMNDSRTYVAPDTFNPERYLQSDPSKQQRKFTEVSETFPVWGYGSLACPGRFHASLVIKMIVSELLLKYDLKLEEPRARTRWSWETFTMPYESTRIILKERA